MTKKRKKVLVKLIVIFILASVLAWMAFLGGCLNSSRVKLHGGHFESGSSIVFISFGAVVGLIILIKYIFESHIEVLIRKKLKLLSVELLM